MLKFFSLYSGSTGNSLLLQSEHSNILIDSGVSAKKIVDGLEQIGNSISNIDAILVTHDISEAISLADTVAVLSHRPTTIKSIHKIDLTLDGEKTPFNARLAPEYTDYFDLFWKELQDDEE